MQKFKSPGDKFSLAIFFLFINNNYISNLLLKNRRPFFACTIKTPASYDFSLHAYQSSRGDMMQINGASVRFVGGGVISTYVRVPTGYRATHPLAANRPTYSQSIHVLVISHDFDMTFCHKRNGPPKSHSINSSNPLFKSNSQPSVK